MGGGLPRKPGLFSKPSRVTARDTANTQGHTDKGNFSKYFLLTKNKILCKQSTQL